MCRVKRECWLLSLSPWQKTCHLEKDWKRRLKEGFMLTDGQFEGSAPPDREGAVMRVVLAGTGRIELAGHAASIGREQER